MGSRQRTVRLVRTTSLVGAAGAACFLTTSVVVNVLQPEADPARTFVSDLVWGPAGWLMTASFWMHGLAVLALGVGLRLGVVVGRVQRLASVLMLAGGAGVFLMGFFPTDAAGTARTWVGTTHLALAGSAFTLLSVSFVLFAHSFAHDPHWGVYQRWATVLGIASGLSLATFLGMVAWAARAPTSPVHAVVGAGERVLIGAILAWVLVVALRLRAVACHPDHFVEQDGAVHVR